MYGYSLPDGRSQPGSAASSTAMRPETLEGYATAAGFGRLAVLPIRTDLWHLCQLHR